MKPCNVFAFFKFKRSCFRKFFDFPRKIFSKCLNGGSAMPESLKPDESFTSTLETVGSPNEEPFFINKETVDVILSSKFLNCISINEKNCKDVYIASRYLNVEELILPSSEFLKRHLDTKNCLEIFFFAKKWNDVSLMISAADICFGFLDHMTKKKSFLTLELGKVLLLLTFFRGYASDRKEIVFQGLCRWLIFNKPRNLNLINPMLNCLEFPYRESYFDNCTRSMPDLKKNLFCKTFMKQARLNNLCPSLTPIFIGLSTIYNEKMKHHIVVVGQSIIKINDRPHAKHRPIIEYYCPAQQMWTIFAYFPKDIRGYQSVISEEKLYFAGGYYHGRDPSLEVWAYDWETSKWTELAPLPHHLTNFGFIELNDSLYIVGGKSANEIYEDKILQYDLQCNDWSVIGNLDECVINPAVITSEQKIFIAGGATMDSPKGIKTFQSFDVLSRTLDTLPPMLSKKSDATVAACGESIYIFGGSNSKDVESFSSGTYVWSKVSSMKKKRSKAGVFVMDEYIYLVGGQKSKTASRKSIERYDTINNKWKIIGSMSSRGYGITCSYIPTTLTDCGFRVTLPIDDVRKSIKRSESLK